MIREPLNEQSRNGGDAAFARLVDEIVEKLQAGEQTAVEDCLHRYPQYAARLEQLLPTLHALLEAGRTPADSVRDALREIEDLPRKRSAGEISLTEGAAEGLPGDRVLGDFRILRQVGRGGMGVVYEAEEIPLGRRVALKTLPSAAMLDQRQLRRFQNESRAAALLDHPNIVSVYSVGCDSGVHYYAMQYIEGRTLADVIAESRRQNGVEPPAPTGPTQSQPTRYRMSGTPGRSEPSQKDGTPGEERLADEDRSADAASPEDGAARKDTGDERTAPYFPDEVLVTTYSGTGADDTRRRVVPDSSSRGSGEGKARFRRVARLGIQAAEALEHAHAMGVVHRDVKPSNLMVDEEDHLWVTDFGLAQAEANPGLTMTGDMVGTLRYMSPEQATGERHVLDHRTDIYSLGVTLYELLALRPAADAQRQRDVFRQIVERDPPRLHQVDRTIPRDLEVIVGKAMAKNPQSRYGSAQELADDLRRFLDDEPIRAKPPGLVERAGKWTKRNRGIVAASLVTLAVAVLFAAGLLWQERSQTLAALEREGQQRQLAERKAVEADRKRREANEFRRLAEQRQLESRRHLHDVRVHLAEQEMARGRWGPALSVLRTEQPEPGRKDLRSFAWRLLWRRLRERRLFTLQAHDDRVCFASYLPDERTFVTAGREGEVKVWDLPTRQLRTTFTGHLGDLLCGAAAPGGKLVATGGRSGQVILWDIERQQEHCRLPPCEEAIYSLAFSPDGGLLACGGDEGTVWIWNRGQERFDTLHSTDDNAIRFLEFSPDGGTITASGSPGHIRLWNLASGEKGRSIYASRFSVRDTAFSPDGRLLASACDRWTVLRESGTGRRKAEFAEANGSPRLIRFSPDGRILAVGFRNGTFVLRGLHSERTLHFAQPTSVCDLAFSPTGDTIASTGTDGSVSFWRTEWKPTPHRNAGKRELIWGLAFSPDGKLLASGGDSGKIELWNTRTGQREGVLSGHTLAVIGLAFSPNGRLLASASDDNTVRLWRIHENESLGILQDQGASAYCVAFSPDESVLATAGQEGRLTVWDVESRQPIWSEETDDGWLWSVAFSPDGKLLAVGGQEGVTLWNWKTRSVQTALDDVTSPIAFSPDGETLFCLQSCCSDQPGGVRVHHIASGRERLLETPLLSWFPQKMALLSNGATCAVVADGRVQLFDVSSGRHLPMLREFPHWVFSVGISPDGNTLATGGDDGTVRFWRTSLPSHSDALRASDDGRGPDLRNLRDWHLVRWIERLASGISGVDDMVQSTMSALGPPLAQPISELAAELQRRRRTEEAEWACRLAIAFRELLQQGDIGRDAEVREALAGDYFRLGALLKDREQPRAAEQAYSKAIQLKQRAAGFIANPADVLRLAKWHLEMGRIQRALGRRETAVESFQLAAKTFGHPDAESAGPESLKQMGYLGWDLADEFGRVGRPEAQEAACRRALRLFNRAVALAPDSLHLRQERAKTCRDLAEVLRGNGNPGSAEAFARTALEGYRQLAQKKPEHRFYRQEIAYTERLLSGALCDLGRVQEAKERMDTAFATYCGLAAERPQNHQYRLEMAETRLRTAARLQSLGKDEEAEAKHREALAIDRRAIAEFPDEPGLRRHVIIVTHSLANFLLDRKRHREARSLLETLPAHFEQWERLQPDHEELPRFQSMFVDSQDRAEQTDSNAPQPTAGQEPDGQNQPNT